MASTATNPMIVTEADLQAMSGYMRRADLKAWLQRNGIWFTEGKDGRIATTIHALDKAGQRDAENDFEFL